MKTLSIWAIALCLAVSGCKKNNTPDTPAVPDYVTAIQAKYKALGWTEGADNGGAPEKTAGGKGFVQYYGNKSRAIYYFDGKAFDALKNEMTKFDALGQDKFAIITEAAGYLVLKKVDGSGDGVIVTTPNVGSFVVYGEIYRKYKELNRWDGPLGYPKSDETATPADNGRYSTFTKGTIWYWSNTGANALWGKALQMYAAIDYERSWLGKPKTSCDATKSQYVVLFEHGSIGIGSGCDDYNNGGYYTDKTGKVGGHPCY